MKNLYKNVKQGAKRYGLPIIAGGLMTLGSSSCNNPEKNSLPMGNETKNTEKYQETLHELDSLENRADSLTYNATKDFNKGLKKGSLESTIMTDGLSDLEKASELYSRIRKRAEAWDVDKYQNSEMNTSAKNLMECYNKTLHKWDLGRAKLEKKLENKGYEVDVYNPTNTHEKGLGIIGGVFATLIAGVYITGKISESMKERKK